MRNGFVVSVISSQRRRSFSVARLPLSHPSYIIWGSNTSLGKTLVSTGIAFSFLSGGQPRKFVYLKPVQTGFPSDSDSRYVYSKLISLSSQFCPNLRSSISASNSILKASIAAAGDVGFGIRNVNLHEEVSRGAEIKDPVSELRCETLYAWKEPLSPHLTAERESGPVDDDVMLELLENRLRSALENTSMDTLCVIETAGGVASPSPSGSLQCNTYRSLRLPCILVGDGRLGGISATISAYETLKLRGYDVAAIMLEDHGLGNEVLLLSYLRNSVRVIVLPQIPKDPTNNLLAWYKDAEDAFVLVKETMVESHFERLNRLREMRQKASDCIWWPFTQHKNLSKENVTVIDSRCGENFAVFQIGDPYLTNQFDGCASWWTQGPDAALQQELAKDLGYAAARYGHVMFPENVYEPALECTELLLEGVGKGWASRVYFSDNGSTAVEIALKMAFRKFLLDNGITSDVSNDAKINLKVLALRGSYHGDTLGAMEAQAPSSYTGFLQQPWYSGRGLYLDLPTVYMSNGVWRISLPDSGVFKGLVSTDLVFGSRDDVFERTRDTSSLAELYAAFISSSLAESSSEGSIIAACLLEPVIQGAGGMIMIDPLFQRMLVHKCREKGVPVIFDEVFTGFWRLGVESAAELLGCTPDIACYAKLMTGGTIPLAATLASEEVFASFLGDSKLNSLLHGHSYSGHALGCTAASTSIKWFKDPQSNANLVGAEGLLREIWDIELLREISFEPSVHRVVALGTLVALELRGCSEGYASVYAQPLVQKLRGDGIYMRPLGNVIYLMCGPCTLPAVCNSVLLKLLNRLQEFYKVLPHP